MGRIVAGLPVNMDGTQGGQAQKARDFVNELQKHTPVPVIFRDERLTTVEAKNRLEKSGKTTRGARFDAAAAALILQSYLDDSLPPAEIPEQ